MATIVGRVFWGHDSDEINKSFELVLGKTRIEINKGK